MSTKEVAVTNVPRELVSHFNLTINTVYALQIAWDGSAEYSESPDAVTKMPDAKHMLISGKIYSIKVSSGTKIWIKAAGANTKLTITEGF